MKNTSIIRTIGTVIFTFLMLVTYAQIDNWRPYDQTGINIFEPEKKTDTEFEKLKVRFGGAFAQQFQGLSHSNNADYKPIMYRGNEVDGNQLYDIAPGFNMATANLYIDAQLADGIRLGLESYMSSRHHSEFWVKGGYIQVDKLPMFDNTDWFSKYVRVKLGHFQVNYGDQQFRRTDNGNAMYNPFVGNYIMDAFATEIGGEVYIFPVDNVIAMVGMTSGYIKGDVQEADNRAPSVFGKLAYDKQISEDLRFRLSGSVYANSNAGRNTLYSGDRAGSRFYMAMEPAYVKPRGSSEYTTASAGSQFTSGRVNPGFSNEVVSFQFNPFVKYKGFELFGTFEQSKGLAFSDPKGDGQEKADSRTVNQFAVEGIYRFLKNEQLYIAARYNQLNGELNARILDAGAPADLTVDRVEIAAGWFPIKHLLLKAAYIKQTYKDYPSSSLYSEGEFDGIMIEAVAAF